MEKFDLNYSLKSIPIHEKTVFQNKLVENVEKVFTRMRWKLWHIRNPRKADPKETFGFRTVKVAPPSPDLQEFEEDVLSMVTRVEYRNMTNPLLTKLKEDARAIRRAPEVLVKADKTTNIYKVSPRDYTELLQRNIQKDYKKVKEQTVHKVNKQAAKLANKLDLAERIDRMTKAEAFITIKDHKERFPDTVAVRLINPAKSNMGRISKKILADLNKELLAKTKLNQWRNSEEALEWRKGAKDKGGKVFLKFDIDTFYPSISADLLGKAIKWAATKVEVSKEDMGIVMHARQAFLFSEGEAWRKKEDPEFDITIGSYDGAECCELVGLYILDMLAKVIPVSDLGIYRDDGLAVVKGSGREVDKIRQKIVKVFQECKLKVKIEANMKITDFLDISFDLNSDSHRPYTKPGQVIRYVPKSSNHPPHIKKSLPRMIATRLSRLSSNEGIFQEEVPAYQEALKQAGYDDKLEFIKKEPKKNSRQRKIIWFNPPWNDAVSTNVAAKFLKLVSKHFPTTNPLHKVFNRNNVKVSYCCLPNMNAVISGHNKKVLSSAVREQRIQCRCRGGQESCPVGGQCETKDTLYSAEVDTEQEGRKVYIGSTANTFKKRWTVHKSDCRLPAYEGRTKLSSHIWSLKKKQATYSIRWNLLGKAKSYTPETRRCALCTAEKTKILHYTEGNLMNVRSEIMNKCRHRDKHTLRGLV